MIGLPYTAQWKSAKLGLQPSLAETLLNQQMKISHLGLVARWLHAQGIQFGPDFTHLDDMPLSEAGAPVDPDAVREVYDEQELPFPGTWDTNSRACIQAQAPRPATMLAITVDMDLHD